MGLENSYRKIVSNSGYHWYLVILEETGSWLKGWKLLLYKIFDKIIINLFIIQNHNKK